MTTGLGSSSYRMWLNVLYSLAHVFIARCVPSIKGLVEINNRGWDNHLRKAEGGEIMWEKCVCSSTGGELVKMMWWELHHSIPELGGNFH